MVMDTWYFLIAFRRGWKDDTSPVKRSRFASPVCWKHRSHRLPNTTESRINQKPKEIYLQVTYNKRERHIPTHQRHTQNSPHSNSFAPHTVTFACTTRYTSTYTPIFTPSHLHTQTQTQTQTQTPTQPQINNNGLLHQLHQLVRPNDHHQTHHHHHNQHIPPPLPTHKPHHNQNTIIPINPLNLPSHSFSHPSRRTTRGSSRNHRRRQHQRANRQRVVFRVDKLVFVAQCWEAGLE